MIKDYYLGVNRKCRIPRVWWYYLGDTVLRGFRTYRSHIRKRIFEFFFGRAVRWCFFQLKRANFPHALSACRRLSFPLHAGQVQRMISHGTEMHRCWNGMRTISYNHRLPSSCIAAVGILWRCSHGRRCRCSRGAGYLDHLASQYTNDPRIFFFSKWLKFSRPPHRCSIILTTEERAVILQKGCGESNTDRMIFLAQNEIHM